MRPTPALAIFFTLELEISKPAARSTSTRASCPSRCFLLTSSGQPPFMRAKLSSGCASTHRTLTLGGHQLVDLAEFRKQAEGLPRQRLARRGKRPGDGSGLFIGSTGERRPAGGGENAARPVGFEQLACQPIHRPAALFRAVREADRHVDGKRSGPGASIEQGGEVRDGQALGLPRLQMPDDYEPAGAAAVRARDEGARREEVGAFVRQGRPLFQGRRVLAPSLRCARNGRRLQPFPATR